MFVYIVFKMPKHRWERILLTSSYEKAIQESHRLGGSCEGVEINRTKWWRFEVGTNEYAVAGYDLKDEYDLKTIYRIIKEKATK
jgi:hypothetical protein